MNSLKHICLTLIQLIKQAGALPRECANAIKQRQQRAALNVLERERIDRIRNPSKYRGQ